MPQESRIQRVAIHDWGDHPCPPDHLRNLLEHLDTEVEVRTTESLRDCDGVVTVYHHNEFLEVEAVEWVHTIRSGYNDFPLDAYREADITVTNSTGVAGDLVGETAVSFMLMLAKGLHRYRDQQQERSWERISWERPFELRDISACVVGLGELGGSVAVRAGVLGISVVGVDIRPVSALGLERVYDVTRLAEAVSDVRFVVLTTPLTEGTRGLVGRDVFEMMDDDAYLINVSRGEIVDQNALVRALKRDKIAGAALDVFRSEPLETDSPLWDMEEVIVTPHTAAQSNSYGEKVAKLIKTNVSRLNDGRTPWNEIE